MHASTSDRDAAEPPLEDFQRLLLNPKPAESRTSEARTEFESEKGPKGNSRGLQKDGKKYKIKNPIVWMDLEMTGLDANKDHIMEIAVLITDGQLTGPHLEGPELRIHLSDEILNNMNKWCTETHGKSGLTEDCRRSKISLTEAEDKVLEFLQAHTQTIQEPGSFEHKAHLAGNSVYVDRAFLQKHMPRVHAHLHWRLIDVSTILELARRWFPEEFKRAPKKKVLHTAMADIRESLKELKFYRRTIFKQPSIQYKDYLAMQSGSRS